MSLVVRRRAIGASASEHATVVEILAGRVVLLSSAALETELAFGALLSQVVHEPRRVLIGGLGFGATLQGVLDVASPRTHVEVVEKVPDVIELVRAQFPTPALDDPRVVLTQADVFDVITKAPAGAFDAILLDVDNGPEWASFRTNARLYTSSGVSSAARALAPGGALLVWSGYARNAFTRALRAAGLQPSIVPLHERGKVRARAYIGSVASSST
jgi:spermidine synthase